MQYLALYIWCCSNKFEKKKKKKKNFNNMNLHIQMEEKKTSSWMYGKKERNENVQPSIRPESIVIVG